MSETSLIRDVSDTALWVAHYRAEESARPDAMFHDPLAARLVGDRGPAIAKSFGRISRHSAWSIVTRTVMIDDYLREAVANGVDAVLNLGAGLDTRPYRLELPPTFPWVEVDLPHLIEFKEQTLRDQMPRCRLQRVGVNLTDARERRAFLASVLPDSHRVLVLTEGVVPYLTQAQVGELAGDLKVQSRFAFWIAEYYAPHVYPYLRRIGHSNRMRNAPFQFFPPDWLVFFAQHGWLKHDIRYGLDVGERFNRRSPLNWFARLFLRYSAEARERLRTGSGYMLMTPRD